MRFRSSARPPATLSLISLLALSVVAGCNLCPTGEDFFRGSSLDQGLVVAGILGQGCYSLNRELYVQPAPQWLEAETDSVLDLGRALLDVDAEQSRLALNAAREPTEQFVNAGRYLACLEPREPGTGRKRWTCLSFDLQVGERIVLRAYSAGDEWVELFGAEGRRQSATDVTLGGAAVPCQQAERFIHACNPAEAGGLGCVQHTAYGIYREPSAPDRSAFVPYFDCVQQTLDCTDEHATWSDACVFPEGD